ncbi:MAG: YicC family protein [Fervidobacterium sp.]
MPKSMTGYGKLQNVIDDYKITCEVKALNSKGLNVEVFLPFFLNSKELDAISMVKKFISRGKVSVRIWVKFIKPTHVNIDYSLMKTYYDMLSDIRENLGIPAPVDLSHLLNFRELFIFEFSNEEIDRVWNAVSNVLEEVLKSVVEEKQLEGNKLALDLLEMNNKMKEIVSEISKNADKVPQYIAERIRTNIKEILTEDIEINRELFENALAIAADKADIREEITRLQSHLQRVDDLLKKDEPVGDMLYFLSQEIHREFNTVLSKSRLLEINNLAIEGKYLVSQFKEQIMNIE